MKYFLLLISLSVSTITYCIKYVPTALTTTVLTKTNKNYLQKLSLPTLLCMHHKEQRKSLPYIQESYQNIYPCCLSGVNSAYLQLQQKMFLPKIVPLFLSPELSHKQHIAEYNGQTGSIIVRTAYITYKAPTHILSTLLHELRHSQQHLAGIDLQTQSCKLSRKIEQDAERFAATAQSCLACLLMLQLTAFKKPNPEGYFCQTDFNPYIHRAHANNILCKAHNQMPKTKLLNITPQSDFAWKNLEDRVPKKIPAMRFFARPPKN
jgi:hypothetical protein